MFRYHQKKRKVILKVNFKSNLPETNIYDAIIFAVAHRDFKDIDFKTGNQFLTIPISTGMDITRNALISYNCDLGVAISGAYGTLSEIAYTLAQDKKLLCYNSWDIPGSIQIDSVDSLIKEVQKCLNQ